jgi:hypothetical protein
MRRRRKKNPIGSFPHEHPWMTLFLGLGVLETVRVAVRGWEPTWGLLTPQASTTPAVPPAATPAVLPPPANAPTTTTAGLLGLPSIRGLYR